MLNTFHKVSKFILIFSSVLGGWTAIVLSTNTSFELQIKDLINEMYLNQKKFIFNVKDLSLFLVKDANQRFSVNHQDLNVFGHQDNDFLK